MSAVERAELDVAYDRLTEREPLLGQVAEATGRPDPFEFPDGGRTAGSAFAGMVLHIIAQQISTTVAMILYDRLSTVLGGPPTPDSMSSLTPDQIRSIGVSHAKADYLLNLARETQSNNVDFQALQSLADADAETQLTRLKGVGPWSAEMFMIHQLRRPDILPAGDLGIRLAVRRLFNLEAVPTIDDVRHRGAAWAPYRTYAAALLWRLP